MVRCPERYAWQRILTRKGSAQACERAKSRRWSLALDLTTEAERPLAGVRVLHAPRGPRDVRCSADGGGSETKRAPIPEKEQWAPPLASPVSELISAEGDPGTAWAFTKAVDEGVQMVE